MSAKAEMEGLGRALQSYREIGDPGNRRLTDSEREVRARFGNGSIVERYVTEGTTELLDWIWLSPTKDLLRVRLYFKSAAAELVSLPRLKVFQRGRCEVVSVSRDKAKHANGVDYYAEVTVRLNDLLKNAEGADTLADRIRHFVIGVTTVFDAHCAVPR